MTALICGAPAVIILALIAIDTLRDRARQRREDQAWTELMQMLEDT